MLRELTHVIKQARGKCCRGGFAAHRITGETVPLACESPGCPDCGPRRAALTAFTYEACHPGWERVMVTLTYQDSEVSPHYWRYLDALRIDPSRGGLPRQRWKDLPQDVAPEGLQDRRLREACMGINGDLRRDWKALCVSLFRRLPALKQSFILKAFELGTLSDRPHVHWVVDLPPGTSRNDLARVLADLWGRDKALFDESPRLYPVYGKGFFQVDTQRESLISYLLGYVTCFAKKGVGYISRSRNLCQAERECRNAWLQLQGKCDIEDGWHPPLLLPWEYIGDINNISRDQRAASKRLREAGARGDEKGVVEACMTLRELQSKLPLLTR